jgi:hypothetical protein
MRWSLRGILTVAATAGFVATAHADMKKGTPELKSITAMTFGPNGVVFLGDSQSASIFAIDTGDTKAIEKRPVNVEKLSDALGTALGTTGANVNVNDMKVNPASGMIYLGVTRGKGRDAVPVVLKLDRAGSVTEFSLKDVSFDKIVLPKAAEKQRLEAITSLGFVEGKLIVAGLSNEEFASTLRAIPFPFRAEADPTSVEVYHGAHGKLETNSPVRTFVPYKISGADYLLAAYTCTPLVKIPAADLKPGAKIKGTTIAELGNRNRPLDMIVYTKGGNDYILMANSARGVMKIPAEPFAKAEPISTPVRGGGAAGVAFETIAELKGVMQLDKLDTERALLLVQNEDKSLSLKTITLP